MVLCLQFETEWVEFLQFLLPFGVWIWLQVFDLPSLMCLGVSSKNFAVLLIMGLFESFGRMIYPLDVAEYPRKVPSIPLSSSFPLLGLSL